MIPVLFVHAAGGAARNFGSVLRRLEGATAIDLPGHGRAGGEALRTIDEMAGFVLAQVGPIPAILAGHSMGGAVALTAAARALERVPGVVLIATGARLSTSRALAEKARADWEGFLAALGATGSPLMTIQALRDAGQETVARDLEACSGGPGAPTGDRPWSGLDLAPQIKQPTLLLAGERDRTAPPALVRELAAALPRARVVVLPGAGHVLPVERPEEVAREIEALRREIGA